MARLPMNDDEIIAQLTQLATPVEERLHRDRRFATLTGALSRELAPMVASALRAEALSEDAQEWLEEFAQMGPLAALSLAAKRRFLQPDAQEISREAKELAQCVLANWFAIKSFRAEDGLPAFVLPGNGEEPSWPQGLFDGIAAFAAPPERVARLFKKFLEKNPSLTR